jgi:hypothetical protein
MSYFHVGFPGLNPGDWVSPSATTGVPSTADYGAAKVCRRDRVYITADMAAAILFAAGHQSGKGVIYEVDPFGEIIEHDPDCDLPGLSFQCEKARVLRVIHLSNKTRKRALRALVA